MLQQTRIEVVLPRYRGFLAAFPNLRQLAAADEEQVLSLWSGLGYYSRARSLQRAAKALCAAGSDAFPRELESALKLPGVGPYTAAAVLSIAYGLPHAAVDGNVNRVLSRLARLPLPDGGGEPQRSLAERMLSRARPGDWNRAMMELGQTICLPRSPRCGECPVRANCEALTHDEVALYPRRRLRREAEHVGLELTLLRDRDGRILLERGSFAFLPHLWLPPIRSRSTVERERRHARGRTRNLGSFRHAIVHRQFLVDVRYEVLTTAELRRRGKPPPGSVERRIFDEQELFQIGRASLLTKALRLAETAPPPS